MTIIGFNFSKILATKSKPVKGQINVNKKCHPTNVEQVSLGTGQKALRYHFIFETVYQPKVAEISFEGTIMELRSQEETDEIISAWARNKQLPPKALERIMNQILDRCHIEALIMAKELSIPAPIKLPNVRIETKDSKPVKTEK